MDLTRLYNLTTPELRQEAERLGVADTYAMSRGQLIHAIRNRAAGTQPEGFLGKVLGFAKWAIQAAQEEPRKAAEGEQPKAFRRPSEVPMPTVAPTSEPSSVTTPASVPAAAPESARVPASAPVPASGTAFGSEPASASESLTSSESGPPSRPPAGVFSQSAGMFQEPFPTRTMARILAEQGHFKRALAIYAMLLKDEPGNRELRGEADDVRARARAGRSQAH